MKRSQDLRILFANPLDHFIMICEDGSLKSEPLYAFTGLSVGEVPLYCGIIPGKYNSPKTLLYELKEAEEGKIQERANR